MLAYILTRKVVFARKKLLITVLDCFSKDLLWLKWILMTLAILTFHTVPPRFHFLASFGKPQLYSIFGDAGPHQINDHIRGLWKLPITTPLFTFLVRQQLLVAVVITRASSLFTPKLLWFQDPNQVVFLANTWPNSDSTTKVSVCLFLAFWESSAIDLLSHFDMKMCWLSAT